MNTEFVRPQIGQWYARADKGELFQVVGLDSHARTILVQSFDGDIDEIEEGRWGSLLLERSEQPENWTGPMDVVEPDDLGYSDTEMTARDWQAPLQPVQAEGESWEDTRPEDERDALGEGTPSEEFSADDPQLQERA